MTISELIERLEALKAEHGDLPVEHAEGFDSAPSVHELYDTKNQKVKVVWL